SIIFINVMNNGGYIFNVLIVYNFSYLSWIFWFVLVIWSFCSWNWLVVWINRNNLTHLLVNYFEDLVAVFLTLGVSCCEATCYVFTILSLLVSADCYIAINNNFNSVVCSCVFVP